MIMPKTWAAFIQQNSANGGDMPKTLSLVVVFVSLILSSTCLVGQSTGTLTGQVTDNQGAAVVGASVTVQNVETNLQRAQVTNEFGYYSFNNLPVGKYILTVSAKGFKTASEADIRLDVNQRPTVNVVLSIGSLEEKIDVQSAPVLLQTTDSTLSQVVESELINDLPLNGRNVTLLLGLQAGVTTGSCNSCLPSGTTSYANPYVYETGGSYLVDNAVNGGRGNQTQYLLDGGTNTHQVFGVPNPYPNPDAVQEFSVLTSNYS